MKAFEVRHYRAVKDVLPLSSVDVVTATCATSNCLFSPLSDSQSCQHIFLCILDNYINKAHALAIKVVF